MAGQHTHVRKKNIMLRNFFIKFLYYCLFDKVPSNKEQGITLYIPESCNVDLVVLEVLQVKTFHIKRGESVVVLKINK